jgi:hypothetical protein
MLFPGIIKMDLIRKPADDARAPPAKNKLTAAAATRKYQE